MIERARGPLEPLTPSPYASVIYSVLEPAQTVAPSDPVGQLGPVSTPPWISRGPSGLAPFRLRATPRWEPSVPVWLATAWDRANTMKATLWCQHGENRCPATSFDS